ncbi:MAG: HU family DNA-binding protein [Planctomycetota bacterium]
MNKAELIAAVAKEMGGSRAESERAVNCVLETIQKGVKKDTSCQIVGFGTWTIRKRAARNGRNPQTGAPIKIKASKTVGFKPSANFKKMV